MLYSAQRHKDSCAAVAKVRQGLRRNAQRANLAEAQSLFFFVRSSKWPIDQKKQPANARVTKPSGQAAYARPVVTCASSLTAERNAWARSQSFGVRATHTGSFLEKMARWARPSPVDQQHRLSRLVTHASTKICSDNHPRHSAVRRFVRRFRATLYEPFSLRSRDQ